MNIKNVLVPVDFSPPSRLAVGYGVSLARMFRARLTLMHVLQSMPPLAYPWFAEGSEIEKKHREQAERMLSALLGAEDQDDLDMRIVVKSGDVRDEILSAIKEHPADIAVMGTHGRNLLGRLLIGSVTQSILRKAPIPILTICNAMRPMPFKRILFATDLSESSKKGLDSVVKLAQMMCSDVIVFHAMERASLTYGGAELADYVSKYNLEGVRAEVAELVAHADCQKVKIETLVVEGAAAEEVIKAADENTADLILITVKNKGLVERALLGTTAERVIREAHVPVLSIPVN